MAAGTNPYLYANANPGRFTDRLGLQTEDEMFRIKRDLGMDTSEEDMIHEQETGQMLPVRIATPLQGGVAARLCTPPSGLAGRYGDLKAEEINAIQSVVNQAGRPLEVVGSAARGARRPGSDIDYVAPPASINYFRDLQGQLPGMDQTHGIIPGHGNPYQGPVIRFEPN
jgi:hypothetical protein